MRAKERRKEKGKRKKREISAKERRKSQRGKVFVIDCEKR
jgi:hypothetical protein